MRSFEIEVILVKHLFKSDLYFAHISRCFKHRFIKTNQFCTLPIKCSLHRHPTKKMFARDEHEHELLRDRPAKFKYLNI